MDWPAFRALFLAQLRMDFRRSSPVGAAIRQKEASLRGRMMLSFLVYVMMSLPLALSAAAVSDARTYAALVAGYVMTMGGMMLVMEFGVTVLEPLDALVLGPRPVSASAYTAAKLANLLVFVGFYGIAMAGLPLLMAPKAAGAGWAFAGRLALASAVGTMAAGGLLAAGYGLLARRVSRDRIRDALNWLTIAFSVLVPVAYLGASRFLQRTGSTLRLPVEDRTWMEWLPPVWMAGAVDRLAGEADALTLRLSLRAALFAGAGLLAWGLLRRWAFRLDVEAAPREAGEQGGGRRTRPLAWLRPLFSTPAEWGVFRLILAFLARDRGTRARILPQFAMSVAFMLIACVQGLPDPWAGEGKGEALPFLIAGYTALTCAWVPLLLRFSEQWEAAWAFACAPGATLADMSRGMHRAVLLLILLPAFLLTWLFYLACWGDPAHALWTCAPPFLGAAALMQMAMLWRKPVPLAVRYVKGETGSRIALTFVLMALFALLWGVQQAAAGSQGFTLVLMGAELTALFALDWLLVARLSGRSVVLADL